MNKNNSWIVIVLILCLLPLLYFAPRNEYSYGGADNYWHYFFSRYAFKYPKFFLHHWGKPVFILLSSPFSQFGLNGIKLFNILCALLSSIVCVKFCRDIGLKFSWLVIPVLLFNPLYFLVSQSALTEPLFSFILIFSAYLLYKENFFWGALLASSLMFSRTEGLFLVVYYGAYLCVLKKWKYIPLLTTTFIIYACIGSFSGHNFFWFFTENPYALKSSYGHGDTFHFFRLYQSIFGLPHVLLLLPGIFILLLSIIKKNELNVFQKPHSNTKIFLLVFIPAIMFFVFHVVSWRFGKFSSAGLERVMACIIPCTAILCMFAVNALTNFKMNSRLISFAIIVILLFIVSFPFITNHFPLKAYSEEKAERDAATWLNKSKGKDFVIYYAHPAIVFYTDRDPFDREHNKECFSYYKECNVEKDIPFYYFWDSSFSEFSCKTSISDLDTCTNMKRIKDFKEDNFLLAVYECIPELTVQNDKDPKEKNRKIIHLQAVNGKYVCTDKTKNNEILANSDNPWKWETYLLISLSEKNQYAIRACNNLYLCADADKQGLVNATGQNIGDCETFTIIKFVNNSIALKASNGKYLSVDEKTRQLFAKGDSISEKEKFTLFIE